MQHHLHDPDLIADFAEGSEDAALEARRFLDECGECRGEYETQKHVKELLSSLPQLQMTESERQRLHGALSHQPRGQVLTLSDRRRAQRWMKIGTVAAGLFMAVGLGSVFVQMNQGSGGSDMALESLSVTTSAAAATTAGAAESDSGQVADGQIESAGSLRSLDGGNREAVRAEIDQLIRELPTEEYLSMTEPRCNDQLGSATVLAEAESTLDDRPIVIFVVDDGEGPIGRVFDQATCSEVDLGAPE